MGRLLKSHNALLVKHAKRVLSDKESSAKLINLFIIIIKYQYTLYDKKHPKQEISCIGLTLSMNLIC